MASHARPLRLLWLLNALEEQTLQEPWELIVVHDLDADAARRVLAGHPLAGSGRLRHIAIDPGTGSPARQRNLGWKAARGELVAFTDDDCRPEPEWLERLLRAARRSPGAVVQGATRPDPLEGAVLRAPHVRTMSIDPVGPFAQTCNILYPCALLERLDGFDERAITGEDVDLSLRARPAPIVAASDAIVNHAVESHTLPGILRQNLKWRHLAYLVKRHPDLRDRLCLRVFWDADHLRVVVAAAGLAAAAATRRGAPVALAGPYAIKAARRRGPGARATALAAAEIPGQFARQLAEVAGMAAGSVRHRTLLL